MLALRRGYERADQAITDADRKLQAVDRGIARGYWRTRMVGHEVGRELRDGPFPIAPTREEREVMRRRGLQSSPLTSEQRTVEMRRRSSRQQNWSGEDWGGLQGGDDA